ncbi:Gfo/Idh/MocA family protein [Mycobacterium antarcticum]|uniref:Gfo/Idh/MocA family protein n=1 Tax=unclassified Mycolicibacterium TaxID=2636767 RepID=UPI0024E0C6F3|nr:MULTISPECIES: Gfo/Idh/MocA family oxidoreductase [unclassified Mycolicibacterium]
MIEPSEDVGHGKSYYAPPLRAAIVGTGGISRIHGWRLQDLGSSVVGVCGRNITNARSVADDFDQSRDGTSRVGAFDDLTAMLDETRPDVLHVCSPHGLHAAHAIAAVNRGINVIIEKPMATGAEDARALIAAADAAGVTAAVCLTKRSYPMVADMRARILAGELGEVNAVRGGFLSWDSNHDEWSWSFDSSIAGTSYATADLGVHWLDLAEYVTGRRITEVDARFSTLRPIRNRGGEPIKVKAEDYVRLFLEFSGGLVGSATFSGVTAGEPNGCSLDVDGTDGGFYWKVDRPNELVHRRTDGSVGTIIRNSDVLSPAAARLSFSPAGHAEGFGDAFRNLFRDVYSAIGGADVGYPTLADGHRMVALVDAIQLSAQTRSTVGIG